MQRTICRSLILPSCPWFGARGLNVQSAQNGHFAPPTPVCFETYWERAGGGQVHRSLALVTGRVLNRRAGRTKALVGRAVAVNPKNDIWRSRRGPYLLHSPAGPTARGAQITQRRPLCPNTSSACNVSGLADVPLVCSGPLALRLIRGKCWPAWAAAAKHQHTHRTKVSPYQAPPRPSRVWGIYHAWVAKHQTPPWRKRLKRTPLSPATERKRSIFWQHSYLPKPSLVHGVQGLSWKLFVFLCARP